MLRYLNLFPKVRPVVLHKDVCLIPATLAKNHGWFVDIVFCQPDNILIKDPYNQKNISLVSLGKTEHRFYKFLKMAFYIFTHPFRYDVINLHQFVPETAILSWIVHICNPKAVIFLKLDMDSRAADKISKNFKWWGTHLFKFSPIAFFTAETTGVIKQVGDYFKKINKKLLYMPSGFDGPEIDIDNIIANKENIVLTVGRLGMPQKNTELLLEAWSCLAPEILKKWKLVLVGSMADEFVEWFENWKKSNGEVAQSVEYVGELHDRELLYKHYMKAKIFALPSRWESFGLVAAEAMYFGSLLIASRMDSIIDMTNNGKDGLMHKSENKEEEISCLMRAMTTWPDTIAKSGHIRIKHYFSYSIISKQLNRRLLSLLSK